VIARPMLAAFLLAIAGCQAPPSPREPLRQVVLPDLSRATGRVQAQLKSQYAALEQQRQHQGTPPAELAAAFGEMGKLFMAAEYRDAAEASLSNAQTLAPSDARWPYYLGHLHKARGDAVKSAAAFERACTLQPDDPATLIWLANTYLDQSRPGDAEPLFTQALSRDPRSIAAAVGLGRAALARSDYARAVQHLEQALALDPRAAAIHYPLALAYRGLGEMDKADAHMRQRAPGEIQPPDPLMLELEGVLESPIAYEVRGAKALDERDWKGAAVSFRRGIELAPAEASLHHKLGTALYLDGDARGAAAEFAEALRLSPHFAKAHYSLGIMLGSAGRLKDAVDHLSAAVRDDPAYVEARLRLADVLRASGRSAAALPHYEQAANIDPRLADAAFGYALALVDLGRYQQARDRLSEGVRIYPGNLAFRHALVRLLAAAPDDRVRDGHQAMRLMQDLVAKEPRRYDLDEMMAMTLAELGRFEEAAKSQRDAIAGAERSGRPDVAKRMSDNLVRYERRQPCRTPWRGEDGPIAE